MGAEMEDTYSKLSALIIAGNVAEIRPVTDQALAQGAEPADLLNKGLVPGMDYVGAQFRKGEMYVPEVLLSARAMQASMSILRPLLVASGAKMAGKIVIGTVKGDLHDIGKDLVGMMMEGAGFEVIDLGINVEPQAFVQAVRDHHPQIIGMSALLTTTMRSMQATIDALKEAGIRDQVKVMVGGAPLTAAFAEQIGADAYASNASTAAEKAKQLIA
jgi:5-methyltetrahydrofolate--homocysteine methyltransferase